MKLRRFFLPLMFLMGMYLDSIFFPRISLYGIRPDMLIALIVSYSMLMGRLPSVILACGMGLVMDVMFGKMIGLSAASYIITAYISSFFYQKFYADNYVIPAVLSAGTQLMEEHIMAGAMLLRGGHFPYLQTLTTYILPCALAAGLISFPVHYLMRAALGQQAKLYGAETHRG